MKRRPLAAAIAISVGLIVLLGYFLPIPLLASVRFELVQWAIILAGVAVLVGIGNLFSVHFLKVRRREKGWLYSLVLLVSMLAMLLIGMLARDPTHPWMQAAVEMIIFPVEASLMALLAVTLVFLATALFMLGASVSLPWLGEIPILSDLIRPWLTTFGPAAGGARGLLLGVALGALTTGLRALFAIDRPYGGK
jgi:hypothetical protein